MYVDVLAGLEVDRLVEFNEDGLDGRGQRNDSRNGAGEIAHRDRFGIRLFVDFGFDGHITLQAGAAGERLALVTFEVHQCKAGGIAVVDFAIGDNHLAGGTQAVAAGVGQPDAGAQCSVENRLVVLDFDRLADRFNGQFVTHGSCPFSVGRKSSDLLPQVALFL